MCRGRISSIRRGWFTLGHLVVYCNYSNRALYICLVGDPSDPSYGFLSRERTCFSPNHFFTANGTSLGALRISKVTLVHSLDGKGSLHLAAGSPRWFRYLINHPSRKQLIFFLIEEYANRLFLKLIPTKNRFYY